MANVNSTVFKIASSLSAGGVNQTKSYNEGDAILFLDPITFDNGARYEDNITVTFTVTAGDETQIDILSTAPAAPITHPTATTWVIDSLHNYQGLSQNVWSRLTTTLSGLYIDFLSTDASDDYTITVDVTNGTDTINGTLDITGFEVVDATDIVQNITGVVEDSLLWGPQGNIWETNPPQINDADEAGRTYRVTLTSPDPAKVILRGSGSTAVPSLTLTDSLVMTGTQAEVNAMLDDTDGSLFFLMGPDVTDSFIVNYQQEVLTGATGAPYVQETGQFNYTIGVTDGPDTIAANFNYIEDTPMDINLTFGDTRGSSITLPAPLNYNCTITLTDSAAGSIQGTGWIDAGGGVYTLSNQSHSQILSAFAGSNTTFNPSADYASNTSFTLLLTRDQVQGDPLWYSTNSTLQQTLLNGTPTLTNVDSHDEFNISLNQTYLEDTVATWNMGSITDLAENKDYTMFLTFSDSNAVSSITNWTDAGGGMYTFSGTKTECNDELLSVEVYPAVDYTSNYTITYQQQQTTDGINQGNIVVTVTNTGQDVDSGYTGNLGPYDWYTHSATDVNDIVIITDNAPQVATVTYRIFLALDGPATSANGEFRTFGSGGTSTWNGTLHQLEVEGTKDQVNSHFSANQWWSRGSDTAFTATATVERNVDGGGYSQVAQFTNIVFNTGSDPINNLDLSWVYDEDEDTAFSDDTKAS